jgi:ergot alkaloid biosynthesis protein
MDVTVSICNRNKGQKHANNIFEMARPIRRAPEGLARRWRLLPYSKGKIMSTGSILVTGATGKTGRRIVNKLRAMGHEPRLATREGNQTHAIRFDWNDPASFEAAGREIKSAYLLAPSGTFDVLPAMRPFLDYLLSQRVGRLVLLSASSLDRGGPMMGAVHGYLADNAEKWTVLRPCWFMQNFSEQQHRKSINEDDAIFSATQSGRVGFVSADDIAAAAARALTDGTQANGDFILTGPAAISYDNVADVIGRSRGRPVQHVRLTVPELTARYQNSGLPPAYASTLAAMDQAVAEGSEARTTECVRQLTDRDPQSFENFAAQAAAHWA